MGSTEVQSHVANSLGSADSINLATFQSEAMLREGADFNHEADITKSTTGPNSDAYKLYLAELLAASMRVLQQRNFTLFQKLANAEEAEKFQLMLAQMQAEEQKSTPAVASDDAVREVKTAAEVKLPLVSSNVILLNTELASFYSKHSALQTAFLASLFQIYDIAGMTNAVATHLKLSPEQVQQITENANAQMQRLHQGSPAAVAQFQQQQADVRQAIVESESFDAATRQTLLSDFFTQEDNHSQQNASIPDAQTSVQRAARQDTVMLSVTFINETQKASTLSLQQVFEKIGFMLLPTMQQKQEALLAAHALHQQNTMNLLRDVARVVAGASYVHVSEDIASQVLGRGAQPQQSIFQTNPLTVINQFARGAHLPTPQPAAAPADDLDMNASRPTVRVR